MKNKKTGTIVLYVVLALVLIFAILYFCGVFDKKDVPVEDEPVIEETQEPEDTTEEEKEPQAYVQDAITFDENGVADVGDVVDDPNKGALDDKKPTAEPVSDPPVTEPVEQTTTQQPVEQTTTEPEQKPEAKPQSSGGTATFEGMTVRTFNSVSDMKNASPKKPFETVMVGSDVYKWNGSSWMKCDTSVPANQSTIIDTSDPSWTEQVGH